MRLGVFIPGRLASERLPNKLILPLGESCLWEMACKLLNELPDKYDKYVLCYDKELMDIAKKYPNVTIIERSMETTIVDGPLTYIFKELKEVPSTHLMFLNPCLSFLTKDTIIKGLEKFENENMDYATSVKSYQNWLFSELSTECLTKIDYKRLSTKEIPIYWEAAHCFHVFNKTNFFVDGMMLKPNHGVIEVQKEETIDVDTPMDYNFAKWKHAKKYIVDIDNTICKTNTTDYENSIPMYDRIEKINKLYEAGNEIWYQTGRGYVSGIDWHDFTEKQLKSWGVKYHKLLCSGKPNADVYIDDKSINDKDFFK